MTAPWNIRPNCKVQVFLHTPLGTNPGLFAPDYDGPAQLLTPAGLIQPQPGIDGIAFYGLRVVIPNDASGSFITTELVVPNLNDNTSSWVVFYDEILSGGQSQWYGVTSMSPHSYIDGTTGLAGIDVIFLLLQPIGTLPF